MIVEFRSISAQINILPYAKQYLLYVVCTAVLHTGDMAWHVCIPGGQNSQSLNSVAVHCTPFSVLYRF